MAEFTSRIRLVGTDQTGEAFRSAAQNHERLMRSMSTGAAQQQALFGRMAGGVAGLERRLTAATAAMGAGAFLRESLTDFAQMDRRLTRLSHNADVPRSKINALKKDLNAMADDIGIGRENMLKGFETYVRQTGDFGKARANIREIGEAAHAMNAEVSDVAQTARILNQALNIDPSEMAAAFDMIATAGNKGNYEAKNIAQSLPELGDAARAAGLSGKAGLAEMLAIMETISDKVKEPEQVMQAMRDIMSRMVQPELLNNFQKQSGISLQAMLNDARRNGKSMFATLVQTTEEATKRMAAAQNIPFERRHEMLGALFPELDSRRGMQALLNGGQRVVDVLNAIDNSAGMVRKQLAGVSRDAASDVQRLSDEWEGLKQTIGGTMVNVGVLDVLKGVREEFEGISRAAAIVDQFMARFRTKGIVGAIGESIGDAARNKAVMSRRFELDAAEKRLAEFKQAKERGMSEFSPSERYGGLGIPGLGFQAMPMPVEAGIAQAERDVEKAKLRIQRAEEEQRRAGEIEDRRDRGIRPTTDQYLKDSYMPREVHPEVPPLPPRQRTMGPDTGVQPPQTPEEQIRGLERQRDAVAQGIVDGYSRLRPGEVLGRPAGPIMPEPAPMPRAPDLSGRATRLPRGIVDPYAPPPGWTPPAAPAPAPAEPTVRMQRQSFESDGDKPWKGLIHRTALSADAEPTARGQQDQIEQGRQTNELLRQMLRRSAMPRDAGDDEGTNTDYTAGGHGGGGRAGGGASGSGGSGGGGGSGAGGSAAGEAPSRGSGVGGNEAGGGRIQGGRTMPRTEGGRDRVKSWLDFAQKPVDEGGLGLTKEQAHGMTAMMQGESGADLNPGAYNPNDRGSPSGGSAQWRGDRLRNLREFARRRGDTANNGLGSVETQQQFLRHEMIGKGDLGGGSERRAYEAIKGQSTREGALREGVRRFERPQFPEAEAQKRAQYLYGHEKDDTRPGPQASADGTRSGEGVPASREGGGVDQLQGRLARDRKQAITDELRGQLAAAGKEAGVNAEVYSGGQDSHGPNRTGSHRHDHGKSADVRLYRVGPDGKKQYLSSNNEADRAVMEQFIKGTVKHGATGVGHGPGYMGDKGIHIGGGSSLAWGAGGRAANAPEWVRRAHREGTEARARGEGRTRTAGTPTPQAPSGRRIEPSPEYRAARARENGEAQSAGPRVPSIEEGGTGFKPRREGGAPAAPDLSAAREAVEAHRREMERPIRIRYETDGTSGNIGHRGPVQARREQEASARSARYGSFSDVGVA